jgi:hypothetical protein
VLVELGNRLTNLAVVVSHICLSCSGVSGPPAMA